MPTLKSGYFEVEYTVEYNAYKTEGRFNAKFYFVTNGWISDSYNNWSLTNWGSQSGSNVPINHGSAGGRTLITSRLGAWTTSNATPKIEITGLEALGTVSATFTLEIGSLTSPEPIVNGFQASSVTATSFVADLTSVDAKGRTLTDVQVQYNTSASTSGATTIRAGGYRDITVTGLKRDTLYYFRMCVGTNLWGPWTAWKSVRTLETVPSAPGTGWSVTDITQIDADTTGLSVSDDGGSAVTNWQVQWNTDDVESGASSSTSGSGSSTPKITNLLPGTTYYARVRAYNAMGWGAWSGWKSFTTLPGVYVRSGGVWKNAIPYVRVNGVWKMAIRYVRTGGVWK